MHDLSLCRTIANAARRCSEGRRVRSIHLEVGELRRLDPEHFTETWNVHCADTDLADAELVIDLVPITAECRTCGARTEITRADLRCGRCRSTDLDLSGGDEVTIVSLETIPLEPAGTGVPEGP